MDRSRMRRLVRDLASDHWDPRVAAFARLGGSNEKVLDLLAALTTSRDANIQHEAADAIGCLGLGTDRRSRRRAGLLLAPLIRHARQDVVASAVIALSHQRIKSAGPLLSAVRAAHPRVALGLALALASLEPRGFEKRLVTLMSSRWVEARSWAAFGLAHSKADSPRIRHAFVRAATHDLNAEVRGEALIGLARRHDPRVPALLDRSFRAQFRGVWPVEAAIADPHPSYAPLLLELFRRLRPIDARAFEDQFLEAIWASCRVSEERPMSARSIKLFREMEARARRKRGAAAR